MKNIKFLAALMGLLFATQITVAQTELNNGRLSGDKPTETVDNPSQAMSIDTPQSGVYPVDFDYNNPSAQNTPPAAEDDRVYPLELEVMEEEIMASTNPAVMAEKMNELNGMIADLRRLTEELRLENKIIRESLGNCCSNSDLGLTAQDAYLVQNAPNPFNATAEIDYFVPNGLTNVEIQICNFKGDVLKTLAVEDSGYGKVKVDATELNSGSFVYLISVNGEIIDSKVMVITK